MPDLSPTSKLLQGFNTITDTGYLKSEESEYTWLQNVRGWGGAGRKRKGIQTLRTFESGLMGWMDMQVDGDAQVLDRILVVTHDGSLWSMAPQEFTISFDYLFDTVNGGKLYLQSPDASWWDCTPASDGSIMPIGITYSSTTVSTDQTIAQSERFGFLFSTKAWIMGIQDSDQSIVLTEYPVVGGVTLYSTPRAFLTGVGPVFTSSTGIRYRVMIGNDGALTVTEL